MFKKERCYCPLCTAAPYIAVLALAALAGCAPDPEPEQLEARFTVRPVHVLASDELPDECLEAVVGAVEYFGDRHVSIYMTVADQLTTPELNGLGSPGVIAVIADHLPMSPTKIVHEEARYVRTILGDILAAEVSLDGCDARAVAHGVGHALGLVHVGASENLMHRQLPRGGWELMDEQLAWVAD